MAAPQQQEQELVPPDQQQFQENVINFQHRAMVLQRQEQEVQQQRSHLYHEVENSCQAKQQLCIAHMQRFLQPQQLRRELRPGNGNHSSL